MLRNLLPLLRYPELSERAGNAKGTGTEGHTFVDKTDVLRAIIKIHSPDDRFGDNRNLSQTTTW